MAARLGISPQAVYQWGDLVPDTRTYQLHVLSGGQLGEQPTTAAPPSGEGPPSKIVGPVEEGDRPTAQQQDSLPAGSDASGAGELEAAA